ncbi:MAG TPA: oxaloacetate decarboxylase [Oribacterium sp.]|nr:oxaloacetate decarboxylase [Oribacterium sp.]HCS66942.1 oxaloacetate decarboxylase [Oribacterium sp.]
MLHVASWTETLPMMISGMLGIILVMGIIVLLVMALNKLTSRK